MKDKVAGGPSRASRPSSARPSVVGGNRPASAGRPRLHGNSITNSGLRHMTRDRAEWVAVVEERRRVDGEDAPLELAPTHQMEFQMRTLEDAFGSSRLLAVKPKLSSIRKEDVLTRRAYHSTDHAMAKEALDEAIRLDPNHFKALFNRAVVRLQARASASLAAPCSSSSSSSSSRT